MHPRDAEIIRRYQNGATLETIGYYFGLSVSGVAKVLQRNNVKRRRTGRPIKIAGSWAKS